MERIVNSISFYFLLPLYVALALLVFCFHIPDNYYSGIFTFYLLITLPILLIKIFLPLKMQLGHDYQRILLKPRYRFICLSACAFILICSPLDIYINGFKWFAPETYADIHGLGREIRHVTILCWFLVPVAFIFLKSKRMKVIFISYAILFPILIIDRNRLFISSYALFLCQVLASRRANGSRTSQKDRLLIYSLPLFCLLIFAIVGHFRSGIAFAVPTSGKFLIEGAYPLKGAFGNLPTLLQQVILYITTPIFNVSTIASHHFINQDFLLSQFSPFSRELFDAYPYAPVLVKRFNVGTEFYPFLLYGGLTLVAFAYLGLLLSFILASCLLKRFPNIFTFLIFIKISYNALFMGFAPQFYLLLNLMFIILMVLMWFFAELIRVSKLYQLTLIKES